MISSVLFFYFHYIACSRHPGINILCAQAYCGNFYSLNLICNRLIDSLKMWLVLEMSSAMTLNISLVVLRATRQEILFFFSLPVILNLPTINSGRYLWMKLGISSILIHGSLGCRHHLAIQISFYNGVQIHSASIVLTCRLKLKHVSMYTPYRMMHQQLKVSHAVLAAVCLRCLIDCSYWTSSKRLHLYSLNLKCLRQHVFKCLLSMKFLIPFP